MKAEGDVVASAKEAEQAGQQLIKEREKRITEMEETAIKQPAFQKTLDMKNDQISELQKYGRSRTRRRQGITWL